jgi:chromosomal replication initiator protein
MYQEFLAPAAPLHSVDVPDWASILRAHFGTAIFQDWFAQLSSLGVDQHGVISLATTSPFVKNWIENHYLELMKLALMRDMPGCCGVQIVLSQDETGDIKSSEDLLSPLIVSAEDEHDIPSAPLDPRLTFDQFVVGRPNEFAYAAARRVAESSETLYNPLFLYGPVGHGKTHLMHSIAHTIQQTSQGQKKILYLSAEKFMYYFIRALRYKNVMAFKERFRSVHVLMIDDVQFISGKESTQEEFFHTFNALVDAQRQVVISADKSPSDIEGLPERMKSRLGWGLSVDLHPTNFELRMGILQSKVARQQTPIPMEILEFLAEHVASSVRELEGALNRVVAHGTLIGRPLSLELAQHVLKDLLRPVHKTVTIEDIERRVCDHYHLRITDLHSAKRLRTIARPRQMAMYLAKNLTATSLPNIGRHFGGRDHTTVMHAISTIEQLMVTDSGVKEDMALLRKTLENR